MSEIPFRNELVKKFEHFFKENEKSFTNYQTKAAFSTGILSKNFLDIQRKKRGSTPFSKQFRNFKMNEKNIREVYTEIVTKLLEYDIHYRNIEQLKEIVSWYLSKAGEKWNISISEINYYFALGFSLDKIFENKKEEEHETGK